MMNLYQFKGFGPSALTRIRARMTPEQFARLEKLGTEWRTAKVYVSADDCRVALVMKRPNGVGIVYPNGIFAVPGNTKSITLRRDLLDKKDTAPVAA